MTPADARRVLGVRAGATIPEVRRAWKAAAKRLHPDAGGSDVAMQELNEAWQLLSRPMPEAAGGAWPRRGRADREESSFTVDVLPVEAFAALEIVACEMGSVITDDPPYAIEFTLHSSMVDEGGHAWCRCDLVPEAGATTVHLTVGADGASTVPSVERVRDLLVSAINAIDWPDGQV